MAVLLDIIGDVHGCADELERLLARLGYRDTPAGHPAGRQLVFVGDLVNRGPDSARSLERVMGLCRAGLASCVLGNHDDQLRWFLHGRPVEPVPELEGTLRGLHARPPAFTRAVRDFLDERPAQLVLDDGRLVVSHAGLPEAYHGSASTEAWERAVYGPANGRDGYGFPQRIKPTPTDWAERYSGSALVVHGHHAQPAPRWIGRTLNIDSNCSRGGALTAFRYPAGELVQEPAAAVYWAPPAAEPG
jgi:hypothetical protein